MQTRRLGEHQIIALARHTKANPANINVVTYSLGFQPMQNFLGEGQASPVGHSQFYIDEASDG